MSLTKLKAVLAAVVLAAFTFMSGCGGSDSTPTTGGSTSGETTVSGTLAAPASSASKARSAGSARLRQLEAGSHALSPQLASLRQSAAVGSIQRRTKKFQTTDGLEPLANAVVSVFKISTGAAVATTVTDAAGAYTVTVPVGKGYLVVGVKIEPGTTNVRTVKLAVDEVPASDAPVTLPQGNPTTTVAAETFVKKVQQEIAASGLTDPEAVDDFVEQKIEQAELDFDQVLADIKKAGEAFIDQMYNDLDTAVDSLSTELETLDFSATIDAESLGDFALNYGSFGNNEGQEFVQFSEIEAAFEAGQTAFENTMVQQLGEDYQAKLEQYETAVAQAYADFDAAIASIEGQTTKPADDYFVYLAEELQAVATQFGVTISSTAQSLAEAGMNADKNLDAILSDPNHTTAQECAAWERHWAEWDLVSMNYPVAPRGSDPTLDQLEDDLAASDYCASWVPFFEPTAKLQATEDPSFAALDALWEFVETYGIKYAYKLVKGVEITAEQFATASQLFEEGFIDKNGNGLQDPDEPGFSDADYAAADQAVQDYIAANPEPTAPADTATPEEWDAYWDALEAWFDGQGEAYDGVLHPIGMDILAAEGIVASRDEGLKIVDLGDALDHAGDKAWDRYEDAWDTYWASSSTAYDQAWADLEAALAAAVTATGLTEQSIDTAFMAAVDACWSAVDSLGIQNLQYGEIEDICGIYGDPHVEDELPRKLGEAYSKIGASDVVRKNVESAALDFLGGKTTFEEFNAVLIENFKKTVAVQLAAKGQLQEEAENNAQSLVNAIDAAFQALDEKEQTCTTQDCFNTAYQQFADAVKAKAVEVGLYVTQDEAQVLVEFLDHVSAMVDAAEAAGHVKAKLRA